MSDRVPNVRGGARRRSALGRGAAVAAAALAALPVVAQPAVDAATLSAGKALFTGTAQPPCGVCHTLRHAETAGAIGPVLDELKPDAARVAAAVTNGIGAMPPYKATLKPAEIATLARYVSAVAGK